MTAGGKDPVRWVLVLFVANFTLQRFSVPGISIPVTVPLVIVWSILGVLSGVLEINGRRLLFWLVAAGASALAVIPQLLVVRAPYVSVLSWAYWMVIWLPVVVHVRQRSRHELQRCLRGVAQFGVGLSGLSLVFVLVQLAGVPYRDWLADLVPERFLVQGFAISYPIFYESPIYKSNAWLALEPSFLSFTLGICVVCAVLARMHPVAVLVTLLGLLSTTAGSGLAIVAIAVVALTFSSRRGLLKRHALPTLILAAAATLTPFGRSITGRLTEEGQNGSSTSLRAIQPYFYLVPQWFNDPAAIFFGRGAGSSRVITDNSGVSGLLVPSVAKVLFDYGLVAGALLIGLMATTYIRSSEPVLAIALAVSMFTLQAAAQPLVLCSLALVAFWAPRDGPSAWWSVGADGSAETTRSLRMSGLGDPPGRRSITDQVLEGTRRG